MVFRFGSQTQHLALFCHSAILQKVPHVHFVLQHCCKHSLSTTVPFPVNQGYNTHTCTQTKHSPHFISLLPCWSSVSHWRRFISVTGLLTSNMWFSGVCVSRTTVCGFTKRWQVQFGVYFLEYISLFFFVFFWLNRTEEEIFQLQLYHAWDVSISCWGKIRFWSACTIWIM